jgi:hypothetical protein
MMIRRNTKYIGFIFVLIFILLLFLLIVVRQILHEYDIDVETDTWRAIILNIEEFKRKQGRVPDPKNAAEMVPLGFELTAGSQPEFRGISYYPWYEERGQYNYVLFYFFHYPFDLEGHTITYRSETKTWSREASQ